MVLPVKVGLVGGSNGFEHIVELQLNNLSVYNGLVKLSILTLEVYNNNVSVEKVMLVARNVIVGVVVLGKIFNRSIREDFR